MGVGREVEVEVEVVFAYFSAVVCSPSRRDVGHYYSHACTIHTNLSAEVPESYFTHVPYASSSSSYTYISLPTLGGPRGIGGKEKPKGDEIEKEKKHVYN